MTDQESIAEKIKKLLKLAEKTNFPEEAASAIGKAQALMLEHKISQMMLEDSPEEEIKEFSTPVNEDVTGQRRTKWKSKLANILCRANGCFMYTSGIRFMMVGKPSNAENVRYLYSHCVTSIDNLAKDKCVGEGKTFANNFRIGCVEGIEMAIQEERQRTVDRYKLLGNGKELIVIEKALTLFKQDVQDAEALVKKSKKLYTTYSSHRYDPAARKLGQSLGKALYPPANTKSWQNKAKVFSLIKRYLLYE